MRFIAKKKNNFDIFLVKIQIKVVMRAKKSKTVAFSRILSMFLISPIFLVKWILSSAEQGQTVAVSRIFHDFIFSDTYIQKAKKTYQDSRSRRNLNTLNTELHDVQRIMVQNIDDVLQRGAVLSGKKFQSSPHLTPIFQNSLNFNIPKLTQLKFNFTKLWARHT